MAERRVYAVKLRLLSPFLFQGIANSRAGVDAAYLRDAEGRPLIPATQLRGVLLAALRQKTSGRPLLDARQLEFLFGQESIDDNPRGFDLPERGAALFSDLVGPNPGRGLQTTRIAVDEDTGTVKRGMLQVVELSHPLGASCDFTGSLIVAYRNGDDIDRIETMLARALKLIVSIGAFKSAGFGEVAPEGSTLTEDKARRRKLAAPQATGPNPGRVTYEAVFDRPFLVDSIRVTDNLFAGSTVVPGAVFKGALASRLRIAGVDTESDGPPGRALAEARFSHAFPVDQGANRLDLPLPCSVVASPDGSAFADASHLAIGQGALWGNAPAQFAVMAKPKLASMARKALGLKDAGANEIVRTHVSIDEASLAAEDHKLFSLVMIPPDGRKWRFDLDTGKVADGSQAAALHEAIVGELDGIGRTGATARIARVEPGRALDETVGDQATIMIVTPALMFDGARADGRAASALYADYFASRLGGARLENFYARRRLYGGYAATRFRPYGASYYPFVLTLPGSVFRLSLASEEARRKLADALRHGLPPALLDGREPDWRNCPYVAGNGFGEIIPNPGAVLPARPELKPVEAVDVR